jgi:O-antigen/teichoic acid export membrane protein
MSENRSSTTKSTKSTLVYAIVIVTRIIMSVTFIPIVTRLYSPDDYGNYATVLSIHNMLQTFVFWLESVVKRYYAQSKQNNELNILFMGTMLLSSSITVVLIIFVLVFTFISGNGINPDFKLMLWILPLYLLISNLSSHILSYIQSGYNIIEYSIWSILKVVVAPVLGFAFSIYIMPSTLSLFVSYVICDVFILFVAFQRHKRSFQPFDLHMLNLTHLLKYVRYGLPLFPSMIFYTIFNVSDRLLLQAMSNAEQVGVYSINYQIVTLMGGVLVSVIAVPFDPLLVMYWEKHGKHITELILSHIARLYIFMAFPAMFGLIVIHKELMPFIIDVKYLSNNYLIEILVISVIFQGFSNLAEKGILLSEKTQYYAYSNGAAALINIVINVVTIPIYGYIAAAASTLIGRVLQFGLLYSFSRKTLVLRIPWIELAKSLIASLLMSLTIIYVDIPDYGMITPLLRILLAIIVYIGIMIAVKGIPYHKNTGIMPDIQL